MTNERSEATKKGMERARQHGRKPGRKPTVSDAKIRAVMHLGTLEAARKVKLSKAQYIARRRAIEEGEINDAR